MNMRLGLAVLMTLGAGVGVSTLGCGGTNGGMGGSTTSTSTSKSASSSSSKSATGSTSTGADCDSMCRSGHPAGVAFLAQQIAQQCGCSCPNCTGMPPCSTQCMSDAICTTHMGNPMTGSACDTCVTMQENMGQSSTCATSAALGMACKMNTDCNALVMCEITCAG